MSESDTSFAGLFARGVFAVSASGGSVYLSALEQAESGLRLATLAAGLVATVLTCVSLWRKLRQKSR